jgi:diacylglycerol kinase family enzyme
MPTRNILLIINPTAGKGRALDASARLEKSLESRGITIERAISSQRGEATTLAQQCASRYETLVAVGGDGTVFEVANGILTSDSANTALGILPCGTGNDIAVELGLSRESDAIQALLNGRARRIDVIEINCLLDGELRCASVGWAGHGLIA